MISAVISRLCILVFGTLYPAYASYKAVRTKNVKEYVKWMMYWIVFALFTCAETFTDVLFSWFPFYYEIKIILVFWLLSPATKGSSILYRKFVHPALCRRETEIDECISRAKEQGYHTVLNLGTKGVNYATSVIMQTAIRGGGGLVQQLRKSYSLSDLTASDDHSDGRQELDETDDVVVDPRVVRRSVSTRGRSPRATSSPRVDMFFPEVDVNSRSVSGRDNINLAHIRSSEDISSSYIPENLSNQDLLTRTSSVGGSSRTRSKVTRSTFTSIKRPGAAEENDVIIEEIDDDTVPSYISDHSLSNPPEESIIMPYMMSIPKEFANNLDDSNIDLIYQRYLQLKDIFDSADQINSQNKVDTIETIEKEVVIKTDDMKVIKPEDSVAVKPEETVTVITDVNVIPEININLPETEISVVNESTDKMPDVVTDLIVDNIQINNEESMSIGASSSNFSSDDENSDSEFNTPNSSPVMTPKMKHKKRLAPPPPKPIEPEISIVVENTNVIEKSENVKEIPSIESNIVEIKETLTPATSENQIDLKQSKKKSKKDTAMSKFMNLPSKLAFWKSDDALNVPEKSDVISTSSSSNYEDSDMDSLVKTNEGNLTNTWKKLSVSIDSFNEQFLDVSDTTATKVSVDKIDKEATESNSVRFIPLKLESLVLHTESKSTDV